MKLHLPSPLRKALLAVIASVAVQPAISAIYSETVGQTVYTDFADNCGLYSTHCVNAMLTAVREKEGGIYIYYGSDTYEDYKLEHEMISYESQVDGGYAAGVSYNFIATVAHNGVIDPTFSATKVGSGNAIKYTGIEYRSSQDNTFLLSPNFDYKLTRLSKIVTDVTMSEPNTGAFGENWGRMLYRSGSGTMQAANEDGVQTWMAGGYSFNLGGMMTVDSSYKYHNGTDVRGVTDDSGFFTVGVDNRWVASNDPAVSSPINSKDPLPFCGLGGDSGSPTWFWNNDTQSYVYAGAVVGGNLFDVTYVYYAPQWTVGTINYFDSKVNLESAHEITINAVGTEVYDTKTDSKNGVTGKLYQGTVVESGTGNQLATFIGVQSGVNTWNDLSAVKDNLNWYNYGGENAYLNATNDTANPSGGKMTYADLFYTQNLVFEAQDGAEYNINLAATVDTGIGYTRFSKSADVETAIFNISASGSASGSQLNTSGFVVEAGVELHMRLTGDSGYLREWRKTGEGSLYIEGTGDNNILLNLGGGGTTYLQREDGYAAYNVLASSGTKVVVENVTQIKRDFTFGNGGALLDMNGNSMELRKASEAVSSDGFSIHALTQEAVITNAKADTTVKLTWLSGESNEYEGSFVDTEGGGVLQFIYAGGQGSKLTLHSIYTTLGNTNVTNGEASGIFVQSGTLAIQGTNTVHAPGSSAIPGNNSRLQNPEDWHYADMTSPVTVDGGTFELGSHARLSGTVTVNNGTFLVRESVTHQMEYIEGSYELYDTDEFREFFGHHGSVQLVGADAVMKIEFNAGADSTLVYGSSISGDGSLHVDSGTDGGLVKLTGNNAGFNGKKYVDGGGMVITESQSVGDTRQNKWIIGEKGWMTLDVPGMDASQALDHVSSDSTGVLALTADVDHVLDTQGHQTLFIGAAQGKVVNYGNESEELQANNQNEWRLGGGGGELVVRAKLDNNNGKLVLGNEYTSGIVTLTNTGNHIQSIDFSGRVTLNYTDVAALGNAHITLDYTNRIMGNDDILQSIESTSSGVILMDNMSLGKTLDLSSLENIYLGASKNTSFMGALELGESDVYRFGGGTATLVVGQKLTDNGDIARSLIVDGQTYSGGVTKLLQTSTITGTVTVQGYDSERSSVHSGDTTLSFSSSNVLSLASSVTVKDGGRIDLGGTKQTFHNLVIQAGGLVKDSNAAKSGVLTVELDGSYTWNGDVDAGTIAISGGNLTLKGKASYNEMQIKSGTQVTLGANDTLSATGTTRIEAGGTLTANEMKTSGVVVVEGTLNAKNATFSGVVELRGGTLNINDGTLKSDSTLFSYGGTIRGLRANLASDSYFMSGETVFDEGSPGSANHASISGNVEIAEGATLKLKHGGISQLGSYYEYNISSANFNTDGKGTLYVETTKLHLTGTDQSFGGIVRVSGNSVRIDGSSGVKTIDNLLLEGNTTTLAGNANWSLGNISGDGSLRIETNNKVYVTGEGNWNKTLTKTGTGTLVITGQNALQAATIQLKNAAKLEVGNDMVTIGSLSDCDTGTCILAGEQVRAGEAGVLEIKNGGSYAGSVQSRTLEDESSGKSYVSLLMNGEGTFTLSGSQMEFKDVTAQKGRLVFENAPQVQNSINIARGATLEMKQGLDLQSGQTLSVLSGETSAAALEGSLTLSGGVLSFSGPAMSNIETSLLTVSGNIAYGAGNNSLTVDFTDTGDIELGKRYCLSSSNWENIAPDTISSDLAYLHATYTSDSSGLYVEFSVLENSRVWEGTQENHLWSTQAFGGKAAVTEEQQAVFTNTAAWKSVEVTEGVQVAGLVFDSTGEYEVAANGAASLTAGSLVQVGSGTTKLGEGVSITESADVKAGKLVLEQGSRVQAIDLAEGTHLEINNDGQGIESISGKGAVEMNLGAGSTFDLGKLKDSYSLVLAGDGTYSSDGAVQTGRLTITGNATLSLMGADLNTGGGDVVLGGNLEMNVGTAATLNQNINADSETVLDESEAEQIHELRGNITKVGEGALSVAANVTANRLTVADGSLTVAQTASLDVEVLAIGRGSASVVRGGSAAKTIGSLEMGADTIFSVTNAAESSISLALDTLKLTGDSITIEQQQNVGGIKIGAIQQEDGVSSTLTLASNTSSTKVALFELGEGDGAAGNFSGDIRLVNNSGAQNRSVALILGNETVAKDAHIELSSAASVGVRMGLGLNADTVQIAGLSSTENLIGTRAEVFSGTVKLNTSISNDMFAGDGQTRNLQIAATGDNAFYGAIGSGINISVSGTGTQAFMGESTNFDGSLSVTGGTLIIGSSAVGMLRQASSLTVGSSATLQTGAAATLQGSTSLAGTLAMGGTITTEAALLLDKDLSIILGGNYVEADGVRTYDVFVKGQEGSVSGWENLTKDSFGGFGSLARGAEITMQDATSEGHYQVKVNMNNIQNTAITWSDEVAVGTWDSDTANFTENGERTAYYAGDTVTIASSATISMGEAVHLENTEGQATAGTLNVLGGANATVNQTTDNTLSMDTLCVTDHSEFTINSVADNFATNAYVEEGSTLNVRFGTTQVTESGVKIAKDSGAVASVTGAGTLHLVNTNGSGLYDLGDYRLSAEGDKIDLSGFTGTLELGNDSSQIRLRDDRVGVLNSNATVVVNAGAQFWKTTNRGNTTVLDNDIVLRGNSGAAAGNSKDGFGAVRGATAFNGTVTIEGNAMVSGAGAIAFNADIIGSGDDDTLTLGCYYSGQGAQSYTIAAGADLANMVVRQSGNAATTVNVNSTEGLAENLKFAAGVASKGTVNVNEANSIQRLESAAGDGVVNIAAGKSLDLTKGASYGGTIKVSDDVTVGTLEPSTVVASAAGAVKFASTGENAAAISGAGTAVTRLENMAIDLAAGTRLEMHNITLAASSRITDAEATLVADGLVVEANVGSNLKPLTYGDSASAQVQLETDKVVSFTLSNIQDVTIEGTSLVVRMVGDYQAALAGMDWLVLGLENGGVFDDSLAVTLLFTDAAGLEKTVQGTYTPQQVEVVATAAAAAQQHDYVYFHLAGSIDTPEPTTSTLSLLALAGLVLRRRRK